SREPGGGHSPSAAGYPFPVLLRHKMSTPETRFPPAQHPVSGFSIPKGKWAKQDRGH
ncbi:hypothetical protein P7K49_040887, partial [Saguinus oedipus]